VLLALAVGACGDEADSGSEFPGAPSSRERQVEEEAEIRADRPRERAVTPLPDGSSRSARIAVWNVPKGQWPLTVSEGVMRCQRRDGSAVVTFTTPDRRVYAVNSGALSQGLPRIEPILRRDPGVPGARVDIAPVLERGLELCE
jgi:hypothetical protein